jgi:peptide/nickel transport system ATP-binding protein
VSDAAIAKTQHNTDEMVPILVAEGLTKHFPVYGGILRRQIATVHAVDDVSLHVNKGEVLGIVGESGCGKSTTARLLMNLIAPDQGQILFRGQSVGEKGSLPLRAYRRQVQMVFQDSFGSLNPRLPLIDTVAYSPAMHGLPWKAARQRARHILEQVGLNPALFGNRYPHELSGGQRQRGNLARALALDPSLLILDEAVSALDKSVEAQILNLLNSLKSSLDLTYIFISHDLNVVEYISDRVMVMYLGCVVESGSVGELYARPQHPYTRALLSAMPSFDPKKRTTEMPLSGDPANPIDPPSGCRFRTRCPLAEGVCAKDVPKLSLLAGAKTHQVACHIATPHSGHSRATAQANMLKPE